jgi:hypothetical protein
VKPSGFPTFGRRYNSDGTVDSICPRCFQTLATVKDESEFSRFEQEPCLRPARLGASSEWNRQENWDMG